jgi:molybdopterin synthase sulfur carrier subunit
MKVKFHTWLKTKTGCAEEEIDPPEHVRTIADLTAFLGERHADAAPLFAMPQALRYVIDRRYVDADHELSSSQVVEIYPPVTGG